MHQNTLEFDVRPYQAGDSPHILNIDLKGTELPYSIEDWQLMQKFFPHWKISIGVLDLKPCAFAVYDLDTNVRVARIHKLASLETAQSLGIIEYLVFGVVHQATLKGFTHAEIIVPAHECRGKSDPYDKSELLTRMGFTCTRIANSAFSAYGEDTEGYVFRKPIPIEDVNE